MAHVTYDQVASMAEQLPLDDQRRLAQELLAREEPSAPRRNVMEFCGIVPHPFLGEDAQAWVSRSRREDDEHSEKQWRTS